MNPACHRGERSDAAIHLELQLDCHARRAGLAMTNKGPRRQVNAYMAPHPRREGKRSSRPGNCSCDPLPVPEAKGQ